MPSSKKPLAEDHIPRRIWFIARAYPPINAIGAERAIKLVRSLKSKGHDVHVFTISTDRLDPRKLDSHRPVPGISSAPITRVASLFPAEFSGAVRSTVTAALRAALVGAVNRLFCDSGWMWSIQLNAALSMAANNGPKPELIITTGSPFVSFLAIKHFASRHQVPYILDYRDLWSNNPHFNCWPWLGKVVSRAIEKAVNPKASFITTVSQSCADVLCADNTVHVLYNYPDRAYLETLQNTAKKSHDDGKYHIVYAGTLYDGRTLAPVVKAIAALPLIYRNRIVFDYCGNSGSQALADFRSAQIERRLVCHGMLSKQEASELVACAQLCISVIHNERYAKDAAIRGIMSTKIFDYLALGKPVVNIGPEDNELTLWLQRHSFTRVDTLSGDQIQGLTALLESHVSARAVSCDCNTSPYPEELLWETQFDDFHDRLLWGTR